MASTWTVGGIPLSQYDLARLVLIFDTVLESFLVSVWGRAVRTVGTEGTAWWVRTRMRKYIVVELAFEKEA